MYNLRLAESLFPAQTGDLVREISLGGLLREIISCFIRSEGNSEPEFQELHRHCCRHLSPQKTPAVWCRIEAFPLTGSGKIQKFMLREGYLAGDYQPL